MASARIWRGWRRRRITAIHDMPYFDILLRGLSAPFFAGAYGTLELFGVIERWTRPPCYSLNEEDMEVLANFFRGLSLL